MTTIVFVRHAATSWTGVRYCGRSDPSLSEDGLHAAEELAIRLAPSLPGGVRIVTSPSRRARETATILAMRAAPAVLEGDPRWLEADVGDCEGLTFDEVEAASPGFAARLATGEADIDWDVAGGLGYRINERFSATVGYRALGVDYSNDDGFLFDVVQQGPILGLTVRF